MTRSYRTVYNCFCDIRRDWESGQSGLVTDSAWAAGLSADIRDDKVLLSKLQHAPEGYCE